MQIDLTENKTKVCPRCNQELPITEYKNRGSKAVAIYSYCNSCRKQYYLNAAKKRDKSADMPWYTIDWAINNKRY